MEERLPESTIGVGSRPREVGLKTIKDEARNQIKRVADGVLAYRESVSNHGAMLLGLGLAMPLTEKETAELDRDISYGDFMSLWSCLAQHICALSRLHQRLVCETHEAVYIDKLLDDGNKDEAKEPRDHLEDVIRALDKATKVLGEHYDLLERITGEPRVKFSGFCEGTVGFAELWKILPEALQDLASLHETCIRKFLGIIFTGEKNEER